MMAFRSHLLALLAAAFLCLGLCAASSVPTRGDIHSAISPPSLDEALETVQLWKRRSHSSPSRCASSKSKTIHNENGYGGYYAYEQGSKKSTIGGTTPDGSGTAPRFDNSTGAFVTLADDAAANNVANDKQKYLSYLGGAAVPFKSGNKSPNGVTAKKLDNLGFNTVDENNVKNGDCAVPSTAYGYQYESKYKLSTGNVAVYCLCEPSGLCGCDDHHSNSSFVPAMLSDIGMGTEAQNISKACTISLDGATTVLVDGGLSNGSTKADPAAPAVRTRKNTCAGRALTGGTDGSDSTDDTGAATSLAVNSWLVGTVALGMASLIWL